jgi:hypothetical protein
MSPEVLGSGRHGVDDNGPLLGVDNADFVEVAGVVGSDQHGETVVKLLGPDRVVECVKDYCVIDAMPVGARSDEWALHFTKLPCRDFGHKLTCRRRLRSRLILMVTVVCRGALADDGVPQPWFVGPSPF